MRFGVVARLFGLHKPYEEWARMHSVGWTDEELILGDFATEVSGACFVTDFGHKRLVDMTRDELLGVIAVLMRDRQQVASWREGYAGHGMGISMKGLV